MESTALRRDERLSGLIRGTSRWAFFLTGLCSTQILKVYVMVSITSITISLLGWEGMVSNEYEEKVDMKDEATITF